MARRISIHQAPAWVLQLQGEMRRAAIRGLRSAAHRTVEHIQVRLIPEEQPPPVDTRAYAAGWRVRNEEDGATIDNTVPWAGIIERGARAANVKIGRAMIDALAAWCLRKGFFGRPKGKKQRAAAAEAARSAAWAIAKAMQKRGIFNRQGRSGLRIMERAERQIPRFVVEEITRELEAMKKD